MAITENDGARIADALEYAANQGVGADTAGKIADALERIESRLSWLENVAVSLAKTEMRLEKLESLDRIEDRLDLGGSALFAALREIGDALRGAR